MYTMYDNFAFVSRTNIDTTYGFGEKDRIQLDLNKRERHRSARLCRGTNTLVACERSASSFVVRREMRSVMSDAPNRTKTSFVAKKNRSRDCDCVTILLRPQCREKHRSQLQIEAIPPNCLPLIPRVCRSCRKNITTFVHGTYCRAGMLIVGNS